MEQDLGLDSIVVTAIVDFNALMNVDIMLH
jgi:hypothetical protein